MAHDYANRGKKHKPAARKAGPRSSSAAKTSKPAGKKPGRRRLLWLVILSLVLVSGFGYGLYKLAFVKPDPVANQQTVKKQSIEKPAPKTAKPATKTAKVEPEPKEDGFDFYKMLPKSEVVPPKVEAYKSTPKSAKNHSQYLLQAGSFRNGKDADSLRAKLLLMGMPNVTTSKVTSSSGSIWYRVRVGPFPSRSKLNKAQDQMVRMRLQPLQVKVQ
ncbi:MAG: SPOR domain-containing protein [Motiliproteus sp.]|nr:SPOR domain-containing protein [Motiliproteus sp.]